MDLGIIGLGRMGSQIAQRLTRNGHRVVGYDRNPAAIQRLKTLGIEGADSLEQLVQSLPSPHILWLMVPAGKPVDETLEALQSMLEGGDIVIDGGNSYYKDTLRRAETLKKQGIVLVDVGTSGGIWGLEQGFSLMVGGPPEIVETLRPIFETLAPAPDKGWAHVGPVGAGHFVKMVHNGIEYGLMQAYAEGFAILKAKKEFELDLAQVAEVWRFGSVIRSWLLDLIAETLHENADLRGIAPYVQDSGEGRWTVKEAIDLDIPAPVITLSLLQRIRSRLHDPFTEKLLAALRHKFGGHPIVPEGEVE